MSNAEDIFRQRVNTAMAYVNKIVVESDGYPIEHSANTMRTLLVNAFMTGQEAGPGAAPRPDENWRPETCQKCGHVVPHTMMAIELVDGAPIDDPAGFQWCIVCHAQRVLAVKNAENAALRREINNVVAGMQQALNVPLLWRNTDEFMATVTAWHGVLLQASEPGRAAPERQSVTG